MRTCNAPEKQYRKYYEQWQKKSHVKLLSCRILFFVCSSYFTEQIYYISLLSPTHSPTFPAEGSMASSPLLALLLTCSSWDPTIHLQSSSCNHLLQLSFPDDEPNFTFLGSINCLLHMSTKMSLLSHFYNGQEIQFWTSNINSFNLQFKSRNSRKQDLFFPTNYESKGCQSCFASCKQGIFLLFCVFTTNKKKRKKK